ncbi:MAG: tRNA (adenosine(37)-N6)-threonylcarbamoyltransferase complex ATPase subunit type 1 TsaE [Eubacteriales bacterium]|nr:tRNA (adenosine(37)-N6)-threonylcarbamoyltransferase complex ATPase subunit type 1 TsaE [Eubacteriales bacterium]
MKTMQFETSSPEETKKIASDLASTLKGGEVIKAYGDLGAGKTAFCQGLGKALGVKGIINSPTFNLIKVYQGSRFTLYHVDCYRLEKADEERKDLGLEEVMGDSHYITYIEWPMYGNEELLNYHPVITVKFEVLDEERRRISIEDERF